MGKCKICDSRLRPGGSRRVLDLMQTSRRVCEDCASMLTPPEELDGAPVLSDAGARASEPAPGPWTRTTVRATAATTVALVPRGWTSPTTKAIYLALAALAFAMAATAWLLLT